ncbi:uncharacterized protein [Venturia canescens]|uniref:uncharacterized protein n=1 Tax=Venturia canescens TaxID=32260 RepID=UPI001C9BD462|nr:uncharacterized protein LOC122407412 [Venturia canescens]
MNSLFPPGTTREKGVPVDPTVTDGHANSLVDTATNLEVTVRPKVHFEERLQWKNVGTLVRGQGEMMGRSAGNNINSPRELTSALEPRATSIAKLQGTDERNTTVNKTFYRSSESSLSSNRDVETHVARSSGGAPPESNDKKIEIRPSRSNEALADERRKEFSDNGDDVSRDQLNFRPPSTYPTENVSGNVESVKTLVYRDTTTTSMSSMKIDSSIGLIDRASYRLAFTGKKEYTSDTQSYSSPLGNSRAVGKLYNVRKKRIDRGFMKENSHSDFTTAKATPREYVDYKNSMTTQKNEIDTTKSTKTNDDSHKTEETLAKILHIPVADLKISNFSSSDNSDSTAPNFTTYPPSPNPSPIMNESQLSQDPPNMKQKSQLLSEQPVGKPSESIDTGILNQTVYDNSTRVTTTLNQWPVKHSAVVEGDLVLGGLMMVHEREDSVTCGPVMPQGGVQALEAMLYTLDWLNKRDLVPGVKIGAHILDDCDKDTYGLEMAVDFIKETTARVYLLQMLPEANAVYTNCVKSVQVLSAVPNSTSLNSISSGVHFCMGAFST